MKKRFGLLMIGLSLFHGSAFCAENDGVSSASETSTATATTTNKGFLDRIYVNYFGIYHGAPLGNFTSPYTVDRMGNLSKFAGINFDSELTTAYMLNSEIGIGPDIPFVAVATMGQGVILGDLGIKAFDKKTISTRNFTFYTNLYLQAPTSKSSQDRHMSFAIKTTPYFRYSVPGSRFTFGTWSEIKSYVGVITDKTFKLYGQPYINYQIAPRISLNLGYEVEAHHNVGDPTFAFSMYQTDFQPGFVWIITPKILVNPYIQLFTGNRVSWDTAALGAVINATLL